MAHRLRIIRKQVEGSRVIMGVDGANAGAIGLVAGETRRIGGQRPVRLDLFQDQIGGRVIADESGEF